MVESSKEIKENEKREISLPPHGDSQSAQTCFFGVVDQMSKLEISNGHNWGAIWSYRAVNPPWNRQDELLLGGRVPGCLGPGPLGKS